MTPFAILDAGPLYAFLDRNDPFHDWAVEQFQKFPSVLITCEAVLSEAIFLLNRTPRGLTQLLAFLEAAPIIVLPIYDSQKHRVLDLLRRYSDLPISFADACIVQLSELYPEAPILTVDSDFLIYRRNKNEPLPAVIPPERTKR